MARLPTAFVFLATLGLALAQPKQPLAGPKEEPVSTSLPPACDCTTVAISGGAEVDGRVGCAQHLQAEGDASFFCYVDDPAGCSVAVKSSAFPGAAYRGCDPGVDTTPQQAANVTLLDLVGSLPSLSIFAEAVDTADLSSLLSDPSAQYTVFAPSNDAFIQLLQVLQLSNASELLQSDRLLPLLLYHIGNGSFPLDNLSAAGGKVLVPLLSPATFNRLEASAGTSIVVILSGEGGAPFGLPAVDAVPTLSLPSVPVYDATSPTGKSAGATSVRSYPASNGVLYIISNVLAPPTDLAAVIRTQPRLSTFWAALNRTGAAEMLSADCPSPSDGSCEYSPVTAFAPTNAAFERLARSLNTSVATLLDLPELEEIVLYHLSDPAATEEPLPIASLADGQGIPTLSGGNLTVLLNTTYVEVYTGRRSAPLYSKQEQLLLLGQEGSSAGFVPPLSVQAYNGVVHGLDSVLLPFPASSLTVPAPAPEPEEPAAAAPPAPARLVAAKPVAKPAAGSAPAPEAPAEPALAPQPGPPSKAVPAQRVKAAQSDNLM